MQVSETGVRCAVGKTDGVVKEVAVGLHQGPEIRQKSPWTMMFTDDLVICSESREQVK